MLLGLKSYVIILDLQRNPYSSPSISLREYLHVYQQHFFLAFTTSINQLIRIFKKLRVPNVVIELLILTYRSIFIFLEEMQEIYRAQEIRFGYSGYRNSFRSTALLMKSLFIRVLQKYEDMVISLECKLYNGEFKIGD